MDYHRLVLSHPNLQSFWRLDEASGAAVDLGPGGHDGSVGADTGRSQSPIMDGSQSTASMGFGTSTKSVVPGDFYDFAGTAAFTVVAWVRAAGFSGNSQVVWKRGGTSSGEGWTLTATSTGTLLMDRRVATSSVSVQTTAAMSTATSYMVAGTYDGANSRVWIFKSGELVGTASTADARSLVGHTGDLGIGLNPAAGTGNWNGTISDVAIYDAALPQAMLTRLHLVGHRHRRPARIGF